MVHGDQAILSYEFFREVPEDGMLRGVIEEILQSWANTDALLQVCVLSKNQKKQLIDFCPNDVIL